MIILNIIVFLSLYRTLPEFQEIYIYQVTITENKVWKEMVDTQANVCVQIILKKE